MYWHYGAGVLGHLLWVAAVIYLLWLATRLVRAVERAADKLANKS
jgi:threonine/homoserine/homoserine lactone efflux protein